MKWGTKYEGLESQVDPARTRTAICWTNRTTLETFWQRPTVVQARRWGRSGYWGADRNKPVNDETGLE